MNKEHALTAIRELGRNDDFYKKFYDALIEIPDSLLEDFWKEVDKIEDVVDLAKFIHVSH